jgi:hypothetical protein
VLGITDSNRACRQPRERPWARNGHDLAPEWQRSTPPPERRDPAAQLDLLLEQLVASGLVLVLSPGKRM